MRPSRLCARASSAWLCVFALGGCVSSSIGDDVQHVRDVTDVAVLPRVVDRDVDPVPAQELEQKLSAPLDAEGAVRVALSNNRELRARLRALGVARGRWIEAGTLPNPRAEAELLPERDTRVELRLEYDITRALLAPFAARAAASDVDAARTAAAAAVVGLAYRVRVAFYRLQAAEQALALTQRMLDALTARHETARALLDAGNVSPLELATEEAAYERARIDVARRELDVTTDREALQRLLGLHGSATTWQTRGGLAAAGEPPALGDDLEKRALLANLPLREQRERLTALARRAGWTRAAGWVPDIAVDVHGLHGDPDPVSGSGSDGWRFGAGVSLEIPLFDRRQGEVTSLDAEFDAGLESYHGLAIEVRSVSREVRSQLSSAQARARQFQDVILPAQRRVSEQTLLMYNAMQVGIFDLLEAKRAELQVELEQVDTLREYWSAVAALGALLGGEHRVVTPTEEAAPAARTPARGAEH